MKTKKPSTSVVEAPGRTTLNNVAKWQVQQLLRKARRPAEPLTYQPFATLKTALAVSR